MRGLEGPARKRVLGLLGGALLLTYAQILVGALMRHTRSGLVCGFEILTCLGQLWPTGTFLGVQIHMWHRLVGLLAGIAVVAFGVALLRAARGRRGLQAMGWAAMATVVAQIVLGIYSVLLSRELVTMTFHSSVAALLLAELVAAWWMVAPSRAPEAVQEHELAPAKASGSLELA